MRPANACAIGFERGFHLPAHRHDDQHELELVLEGTVEHRAAGHRHLVGPGSAKFHPRGVAHEERVHGRAPVRLLYVAFADPPGMDWKRWPAVAADRSGRMRMLLEWLVERAALRDPNDEALVGSLLLALLSEYAGATGPGADLMVAVRTYATAHLTRPIYLRDLADQVHLSPFHFAREFRRASGMSAMAYVRSLRVEAARTWLQTSDLPLRAIAERVGLHDEFQLSRIVKRTTGEPPSRLRAASRGRADPAG